MSEINKIYEITRTLSSPDNLKNDFREILDIALKHFSTKYLTPINAALASHRDYCSSHPCKEVTLLKAFKPFIDDGTDIDRLIEVVNTIRLFNEIQTPHYGDATVSAASINGNAIHSDGIYELDEGCIPINSQASTESIKIDPFVLLGLLAFIYLKN